MLVVWGTGGPNTGASHPSLQPVEIPAAGALQEGAKGSGLENSMSIAKAGAQCRVPVPSPPPRHGGK